MPLVNRSLARIMVCATVFTGCHAFDSGLLSAPDAAVVQDAGGRADGGRMDGGHAPPDGGADSCVRAEEACNLVDDDCDGKTDEEVADACGKIILNAETTDCVPYRQTARCVLLTCRQGFSNCDGNPANGCEPECSCGTCDDAGADGGS